MTTDPPLNGLDVLLVEDESLVSFLLEDMLKELGAGDVRTANRLDAGFTRAAEKTPALAVLDVNLGGQPIFPLAQKLAAQRVPLVFITGYGRSGLGKEWDGYEVLQKPLTVEQLETCVRRALKPAA